MARMSFTWAVLLLAALAARPSAAATELESTVSAVIEQFRGIMTTGDAAIGIPVLEPFAIASIPLKIKASPFDATATATNIEVAGVSGFQITELSQIAGTNKVVVGFAVPQVAVTGSYASKGKVKVGFIKVKINSSGAVQIDLKGLKGQATADIIVNADGSLQLNGLVVDSWSYDKLKVKLSNLGIFEGAINSLINSLVPNLIKSNRAKINALAEDEGKKFINQYLAGIAGKEAPAHVRSAEALLLRWVVPEMPAEAHLLARMLVAAQEGRASGEDLVPRATEIIEEFRGTMKTGSDELGLPVTDPYVVARIPINAKVSAIDANVIATNVAVADVSTFKFTEISQVAGTDTLSVQVEVPEIHVSGDYDVNGKVKVGFIKVKLDEDGPFSLTISGLKASATVDVLVNADDSLNIDKLNVRSWSFSKIKITLNELLGGGVTGKAVVAIINKLIPTIVESNRALINNLAETQGTIFLNKFLDAEARKSGVSALHTLALEAAQAAPAMEWVIPAEARELIDQIAHLYGRHKLAQAA